VLQRRFVKMTGLLGLQFSSLQKDGRPCLNTPPIQYYAPIRTTKENRITSDAALEMVVREVSIKVIFITIEKKHIDIFSRSRWQCDKLIRTKYRYFFGIDRNIFKICVLVMLALNKEMFFKRISACNPCINSYTILS